MKTKMMFALIASFFLFSGTAFALHSGGVAHCDACHSMHGGSGNGEFANQGPLLLNGTDGSSTCLNCHDGANGYHVKSATGINTTEGGDFFWVTAAAAYDYEAWGGGPVYTIDTDNLGHNVVAADFGMTADATNTTGPGGSTPAGNFDCTSCHDPHGQVAGGTSAGTAAISVSGSYGAADPTDGSIHGNYRLLGDAQYSPTLVSGTITAPAPIATTKNGESYLGEPDHYGISTDYGSGMSAWCGSCHASFLSGGNMHPTGNGVPTAIYNSYVATGDYTGGVATAYDPLVPFERGETDGSLLDPTSTAGADGSSTVMCLSCHRSHASAFPNMLRWDNTVEFLADSKILNEATTTVFADGAIPYYKDGEAIDIATAYGPYQRQLCNKCHVKD